MTINYRYLTIFMAVTLSCVSQERREKVIATLIDCPCYEEQVHFPSPRPATLADKPKKDQDKEPPKQSEFGLPEGSAKEMGTDKYLDKVYEGMKNDFEKSGIHIKEIDNGFQAKGMSVEKVQDKKKTKELLVSIDGDISFAHGSALVTPAAQEVISKVAKALAAYPDLAIKVSGHTDSTGGRWLNLPLSQDRAQSTANLIMNVGKIELKRIREIKGYADDQRLVITPYEEVRNRRVEIRMAP